MIDDKGLQSFKAGGVEVDNRIVGAIFYGRIDRMCPSAGLHPFLL